MKRHWIAGLALALSLTAPAFAQEEHDQHPAPEHLGTVRFANSCAPAVSAAFNRAVALLHSFAYDAADHGFAAIAVQDPTCAMAHWGRAMTHYHQLWEAPAGAGLAAGGAEAREALAMGGQTRREVGFITAINAYYADADRIAQAVRAARYSDAMAEVAMENRDDDEAQVFYALSLIATASPTDRTHERQKRAADILEPIWKRQPAHPGAPHYLIHAYDSAKLARRGLPAARAYAAIAPSAPHALHMPSHIFTRLGLWDDSIASNLAARAAARAQGDVGEELHAMDYLTYAYLQRGRISEAAQVVASLGDMGSLSAKGFKIGYAANAMPVRLAVESGDWAGAARLEARPESAPQVAAIVWWGRALGRSRGRPAAPADADIVQLRACRDALRASGDAYWATQTDALLKSAQAWRAAAEGNSKLAIATMTEAADEEDALEKLPLTPGPIVPAREQLGDLLLQVNQPARALAAFNAASALAPGRRGATLGAVEAKRRLGAV